MKKQLLTLALIITATAVSLAQTIMPASQDVLAKAYAEAGKQHKNVILIFHASWCGWCKKMEASLNDPSCKKMFDDNYVITTLDVMEQPAKASLENPGSLDVLKQYKGEKSGLPFWVVLTPGGKLLGDSQLRPEGASLDTPGDGIGCPAEEKEIAYFTSLLKKTSKLNDEELAVIGKRFALNKPVPVAKPAAAAPTPQ
jgi:thiol-disulfide isomerase/thioredoxin